MVLALVSYRRAVSCLAGPAGSRRAVVVLMLIYKVDADLAATGNRLVLVAMSWWRSEKKSGTYHNSFI